MLSFLVRLVLQLIVLVVAMLPVRTFLLLESYLGPTGFWDRFTFLIVVGLPFALAELAVIVVAIVLSLVIWADD